MERFSDDFIQLIKTTEKKHSENKFVGYVDEFLVDNYPLINVVDILEEKKRIEISPKFIRALIRKKFKDEVRVYEDGIHSPHYEIDDVDISEVDDIDAQRYIKINHLCHKEPNFITLIEVFKKYMERGYIVPIGNPFRNDTMWRLSNEMMWKKEQRTLAEFSEVLNTAEKQ